MSVLDTFLGFAGGVLSLAVLTSADGVMVQRQHGPLAPQTHDCRVGRRDLRTRMHRRDLPDLGYIGTNPRM